MSESIYDDFAIRSEKEAELAATCDRLAAVFAERAPKHDREGSFPFDNFADLREAGYLNLTVPREYGGDEASLHELVLGQERLARGDGSTALAVGWHVGIMLQLRGTRSWPEPLYADFCREVVQDGAMINSFASEPATGSPSRGGKPETTATRTDGGWLISGRKTYSTLSPILQHFTVKAGIAGEEKIGEFLVRKGPGVSIEETWDTLGMRATGSHDVILDSVFVPDEHHISGSAAFADKRPDDGGWLLHIPACYIGIAWAARDFALRYAKSYQPNSLAAPISELPHIQRQIGQIEAELITARTLLYAVADRWDESTAAGRLRLKQELGLAKYTATNAALSVVDGAMRIVGGASLSRKLPLERMYRDVRAGLHNPPMDDAVLQGLARRALEEKP
ncbi:acyl-CoA dehydrogenase family protein [Paenibacillus ginsengarvi]|uniref:Acyl-CoA dehydrogenase n=1 Tax=Paenibacillus ginsengarvi TaxID=400777 RepID=A0A3B0BJW3_9BACL|nr:acyl-CoA dehydrogenase family protein [Paenibacillus ginsengarvi]RKN74143.1 acyl-CoA dehydrogenase [Paenibacillus ginsengarvi]